MAVVKCPVCGDDVHTYKDLGYGRYENSREWVGTRFCVSGQCNFEITIAGCKSVEEALRRLEAAWGAQEGIMRKDYEDYAVVWDERERLRRDNVALRRTINLFRKM